MDERLRRVPAVGRFASRLQTIVPLVGLYAGGSLASGDYQAGRSDLDLVAVTQGEVERQGRRSLATMHRELQSAGSTAAKLHCIYVPREQASDTTRRHLMWAHGRLIRRPLSPFLRAEILRSGITVVGPEPSVLLPLVDDAELRAAARAELDGYWGGAVRRPWLWLRDTYVDLGLLTLARAEVMIKAGRSITKHEALGRLAGLGVDRELAQQIAERRGGRATPLSARERLRRAVVARRIVARQIRRLRGRDR